MTFGQFLSILRARWWLALLVLLLTVAATVGVSLQLPKQYSATASVVIDFKPDPVSAMLYGGMASPGFMATQVDIIKSERVAQRVVANLKLGENAQLRQQWVDATKGEGSFESWLAASFQANMEVVPARESSVISVSYKAPDGRFAAGLANAFVQAFIDTTLQLRVDPAKQYSNFFETRSKESRDALEKAQSKLSTFQKANQIVATDERLDVENSRLNELSSQLTALQALASESSSRMAAANGAQGEKLQEVLNNSIVSQLKADINRSEARMQEISTRLGDAHPQVQELKASIADMRGRLESETAKVTSGVGVTNTINRRREGDVRASLDAQRAKVLRLKAVRDQVTLLQRDVESAQRSYDTVAQRFTQTTMEGQTTQSNIHVLSRAEAPSQASSPNVRRNALFAVFLGTMLGVALAVMAEMRDRRVRTLTDVAETLNLPILGVMPRSGRQPALASRRVSVTHKRLLAPLPRPAKGA
jgi:polysaccharide biosynthesis transport protein